MAAENVPLKRILLQNLDHMEEFEKIILLEDEEARDPYTPVTASELQEKAMKKEDLRHYITNRHNLSYAKLYQNMDGGYSFEKLEKILIRQEEDQMDGIGAPFDEEGHEMEEDIEDALYKRIKAIEEKAMEEGKATDDEGEEELEDPVL